MSDAFTCGLTFKRGDGEITEAFTTVGEVKSLSGLGKTNELVEVTNFDSNCVKEYIPGLADGQEIAIECNYVPLDTEQQALIADVNSRNNRNFQFVMTDGTTTHTFDFGGACLSWVINPSIDDAHTISFTVKMSGDVTLTEA
jgi:hypothetical protein